jgi:tRNA threonylcarbamoyladenosine biosynthesis protein TsaB
MPVLGIDTATSEGSIALARDGHIVAGSRLRERGAHAQNLLVRIDALFLDAGLKASELVGIAVSVGPGSFTGVRVGMATAKGLAYALGIGLLGISTLEALARAVLNSLEEKPRSICPVIEAGRGEVYAALFRAATGGVQRLEPDRSWHPGELARSLTEGTVLAGDGSGTVLQAAGGVGPPMAVVEPHAILGEAIARWGSLSVTSQSGYRLGGLGPNYVRPSDAEVARQKT